MSAKICVQEICLLEMKMKNKRKKETSRQIVSKSEKE